MNIRIFYRQANLGQEEDFDAAEKKAKQLGATKVTPVLRIFMPMKYINNVSKKNP